MGRHSADELAQEFLRAVPADGTTIGNRRLRELLGWELEKYQKVKDALVQDEELQVGEAAVDLPPKVDPLRLRVPGLIDNPLASGCQASCVA
jgi:hypothetical protein